MKKNFVKVILIISSIFFLLIFSLILFFNLRNTQNKTELNLDEIKYIEKNKDIIFTGQINYAPFEFVNKDGEYNGMMIDLLRWISYEYGFNIQFKPMPFKEAQEFVISGKANGISSLFYSERREINFDFSKPVFQVPASIFVSYKRFDISNYKDLNGKKIAMQRGDYAEEFLKDNKINCNIIFVDDFYQAVDKIITNEVDAVIGDEQVVWYHIYSMKYTDRIKVIGDPLYIGLNCFGLHKGDKKLVQILNKGIEKAKKQGLLDKLTKKWIGTTYIVEEEQKIDKNFIILLNIFIFLIILVLSIFLIKVIKESKLIKETSEQRLRKLINSIPFIIYLCDENLEIIEINYEFVKFFGININEKDLEKARFSNYIKLNIINLIPQNMIAQLNQISYDDRDVLLNKKAVKRDSEIINLNGEKRIIHIEKIPIELKISKEKLILNMIKDITDEKKAEEEIVRVQKLESVGLLAGKIAHDFNNILTGIIGNLSLAQLYIDDRNELEELLTSAKDVSLQAKTITSQLLAFSKGGSPLKEIFDPLDTIKSVINFTLKGISIEYELEILSEDKYYIYADKNQFFQALNNLVLNAIQASNENSKIILRLNYKYLSHFNDTKIEDRFYCIIEVEDEGPGVNPEIMEKIFHPFFTTKSNGSGLGLSSVKTICKNHNGYVFFKNKFKNGAIFYLLFPSTEEKVKIKTENREEKKEFKNKSIILLDDDDIVIETAKKVFQFFNCKVHAVKNSFDLFEALKNEEFEICILDLVIPGSAGGDALIKILKEKYHDMIYIVSSGYSSSLVLAKYKEYGFDFMLKKPYDFNDIKTLLVDIENRSGGNK